MGIELIVLGFTITINLAQVLATAVVSLAIGALSSALTKKKGQRRQGQSRNKLNDLDPSPPFRRVYSDMRAGGYVTERRVQGGTLYLQITVQDAPSAGPFDLYLDNRLIELEGDAYDFFGPGASAFRPEGELEHSVLYDGQVRVWFGLGGQSTVPAALVSENPDLASAPIQEGKTVVWLALEYGPESNARDRWPNGVPVVGVEGPLALVYDPRDEFQDPDDPATWQWSDNQALITLDMVRHEHCVAAPNSRVNFASFAEGADICDELVAVRGGGTEPRYRAAGAWEADGSAPFEMLEHCLIAGASELTEVDGQWLYVAGRYRAPPVEFGEDIFRGPELEFIEERDPADMANVARVSFLSPERNWEMQPLEEYVDTAALEADRGKKSPITLSLEWVTSSSQAYRLGVRAVTRSRLEREIIGSFKSDAIVMHYGETCGIDCATVFGGRVEFTCQAWSLGVEAVDREAGIARLAVSMRLREIAPEMDDFDAELEPELEPLIVEDLPSPVQPPEILEVVAVTGSSAGVGDITLRAAQSTSASATAYQARWRTDLGGGTFGEFTYEPEINAEDLEPGAEIVMPLGELALGAYEVQIRTDSATRGSSTYSGDPFTIAAEAEVPAAPSLVSAGTGTNHATTWRAPDDARHQLLVVWEGDPGAGGVELARYLIARDTEVVHQGAGAEGVPVAYYATSRTVWGNDSAAAGPSTHTTPVDSGGSE